VLARTPLWALVAAFAAVAALLGLLAGIGYEVTEGDGPDRSLLHWWVDASTALITAPVDGATAEGSAARHAVQLAALFAGVVLTAVFLGAVVFRLLILPDTFVFREKIAVLPNSECKGLEPANGHHLAIRLYNGSPLRLVDLRCIAHLHAEERLEGGDFNARYHELEIIRNRSWPLAHTHIPFTIRIGLDATDADLEATPPLRSIKGVPVSDGDFLMVTVRAYAPELGTDVVDVHVYEVPEQATRDVPASVEHDPSKPSAEWRGWEHFDAAR
jgi:hypothetical protein